MSHARQQIREALVVALTGLATTGANVFANRPEGQRVPDSGLPALLIITDDEAIVTDTVSFPPPMERELTARVVALVKPAGDVDDLLDTIMAEVETALYASISANTLTGRVKSMALERIRVSVDGSLETNAGQAEMSWRVTYFTAAGAPQTLT